MARVSSIYGVAEPCCAVNNMDAFTATTTLRTQHRISASVTPYAERHVRLGCGLAVDEADVDAAVAAMARIARER